MLTPPLTTLKIALLISLLFITTAFAQIPKFRVAGIAATSTEIGFAEKECDFEMSGVLARGDCLEIHSEALRLFPHTFVESIRYYKTNRADAITETLKAIRTDDRQLAEAD